eukprot:m.74565 g.74565  ORF g.74565 m.74565 type:complete len:78 (+) comp11809_c0_seq3:517-750(+)
MNIVALPIVICGNSSFAFVGVRHHLPFPNQFHSVHQQVVVLFNKQSNKRTIFSMKTVFSFPFSFSQPTFLHRKKILH